MDGLLLAAEGARPLEATTSTLADWRRQVRELEAELASAESARHAALTEVQAARDALDDAEAGERGARMALSEAQARLVELNRVESAAQAEVQELEAARERATRIFSQRDEERARAETRAQTMRDELAAARVARNSLVEQLTAIEERVAAAADQVATLRTEVMAIEASLGRREAERAVRETLLARIQGEIVATRTARETAAARIGQVESQAGELRQREMAWRVELERLQGELQPVEDELQSAEQRRADLLAERQVVEQQLAVLRAAERAAHEAREARHVAAQRAIDEVDRLNAEIEETAELEAELSGSAEWAEQLRLQFDTGMLEPQESFDLDAARRRIATLQRELRAVGGVADSVVAEYREMSERHSFLEHQSADLRAAMAELETAAVELETHMRERFSEAFAAIQAAFQECFTELFGGGEARLVLTEPDDLLRTGIDIVARPPGKKLQGLLSLSGGERALTIVSLLFGLLKINPTPFCVLDEVDAALDEANVQRFANLLSVFARQIQFIVVTHNRATMDKADAMFGVSMDAAGVSHVFSVRPQRVAAEREAEVAPA
jgi:chromosome segregation protein